MEGRQSVTQIRLTREQIDFLARTSAATRLYSRRYLLRIDILRLLTDELLRAKLPPERVTSLRALREIFAEHLAGTRDLADRPIARLAICLENEAAQSARRSVLEFARPRNRPGRGRGPATPPHESLTLRLSAGDLVGIDTFRCDVRERSGFILSRSALFRSLIDSFVDAVCMPDRSLRSLSRARSEEETIPALP